MSTQATHTARYSEEEILYAVVDAEGRCHGIFQRPEEAENHLFFSYIACRPARVARVHARYTEITEAT